jgi:hypothetical protein
MKNIYSFLFSLVFVATLSAQNPADYENRRQAYIDTAVLYPNSHVMALEAYRNLPVTQQHVDDIISVMTTKSTIDFDIVKLIRVLFLGDGSLDTQILNALDLVPFWVNNYDTIRGFWSENHMIMWMSSDWLLHESFGRQVDPTLEQRLKHYLQVKIDYGFYEFFSATYYPFTLSGLLNLVDFVQDTEIKEKAALAAERLLKDLLMLTTDKGVFYAASGRSFIDRHDNFYGVNVQHLVYLLTGFGEAPKGTSHGGSFLATSTLDVSNVIASYTQEIDSIYYIGHSIDSVRRIHQNLNFVDRIMMQWSSGCYFHPDFAFETATLMTDSNMWRHVDFTDFRIISGFDPVTIGTLAPNLRAIAASTVLAGQNVAVFKNREITLSSIQDFWKGHLGFQQSPVVATVGTTSVITFSGRWSNSNTFSRPGSNMNDHLPCVTQKSNVALVMYRPLEKPFYGEAQPEVSLFWNADKFDEEITDGNWVFGRQEDNYIAVRRHCSDIVNGFYQCNELSGQTWVIIVGNDHMYGTFQNFIDIALDAIFESSWYVEDNQVVYASSITFDGNTVNYVWKDENSPLNIINTTAEIEFKIYPNPVSHLLTIEANEILNRKGTLTVFDASGKKVYEKKFRHFESETIQTDQWNSGVYFIQITDSDGKSAGFRKVLKN